MRGIFTCFWLFLFVPAEVIGQTVELSDLVEAPGIRIVKSHCTVCHSSRLITVQRLSKEDWVSTIRRMQKEEGLWPLGEFEQPILSYLVDYYGPSVSLNARRTPLKQAFIPATE